MQQKTAAAACLPEMLTRRSGHRAAGDTGRDPRPLSARGLPGNGAFLMLLCAGRTQESAEAMKSVWRMNQVLKVRRKTFAPAQYRTLLNDYHAASKARSGGGLDLQGPSQLGFPLALPCPSPLLIWMKKQGEGLAGDKNYDAAENGPGKLPDVRIRLKEAA